MSTISGVTLTLVIMRTPAGRLYIVDREIAPNLADHGWLVVDRDTSYGKQE